MYLTIYQKLAFRGISMFFDAFSYSKIPLIFEAHWWTQEKLTNPFKSQYLNDLIRHNLYQHNTWVLRFMPCPITQSSFVFMLLIVDISSFQFGHIFEKTFTSFNLDLLQLWKASPHPPPLPSERKRTDIVPFTASRLPIWWLISFINLMLLLARLLGFHYPFFMPQYSLGIVIVGQRVALRCLRLIDLWCRPILPSTPTRPGSTRLLLRRW